MGWLKIVERSANTVLTLDEVKQHLRRLDTNDDDELIMRYLRAATQYVENWTGLALLDQTWDYYLDSFPSPVLQRNGTSRNAAIELPRSPLVEIIETTYRDSSNFEVSFGGYSVDYAHRPGRIFLASSGSWPITNFQENAVRIRFRAGFLDEEGSPNVSETVIPEDIKVAILLHTGNMYENRESMVVGVSASKLPLVEEMLRQYRVETSMA